MKRGTLTRLFPDVDREASRSEAHRARQLLGDHVEESVQETRELNLS